MTKQNLTQERLKELLHYDPATGVFTRLECHHTGLIGSPAGSSNSKGYTVVKIGSRAYKAHRLAFLYMTGEFPSDQVDHINRVKDDNRWVNLRPADDVLQRINTGRQANNTTGYRGISVQTKTHKGVTYQYWRVKIGRQYLGVFKNLKDAIECRKAAEIEYGYSSTS